MMKKLPELIVVEFRSRIFCSMQEDLFVRATFPFAQMVSDLTTVFVLPILVGFVIGRIF